MRFADRVRDYKGRKREKGEGGKEGGKSFKLRLWAFLDPRSEVRGTSLTRLPTGFEGGEGDISDPTGRRRRRGLEYLGSRWGPRVYPQGGPSSLGRGHGGLILLLKEAIDTALIDMGFVILTQE